MEKTSVLKNLINQLSSANDSDLDPRVDILRHLSRELFLQRSPQVLVKLKGRKAELDAHKKQRNALNQIKGLHLDKELIMIKSRIERIEGYVERAEQLVTKAGFTPESAESKGHSKSIGLFSDSSTACSLYDLIYGLMRFSERSKTVPNVNGTDSGHDHPLQFDMEMPVANSDSGEDSDNDVFSLDM